MNTTEQPSRPTAPLAPRSNTARELLLTVLTLAVLIGLPYGGWKLYKQRSELEARQWIAECTNITDPWQRFEKLALTERPNLDETQAAWRQQQSMDALARALASGVPAAHDVAERWGGSFAELVDKYPRDRDQREQHLAALQLVWPKIQELSPVDRVALLQMARSCHLQDAESPVASETVLGCLRYGAKALNADKVLARLLVSARLPRPLTAAP